MKQECWEMKKSKELLDLPIISISEGHQIGKVKGLIINPNKFSVDFLTVEQEDWQVSVKAVPYKKIVGIGEFAVMVEQDNSVIDLNDIPFLNELLNKNIHLNGSPVLTRKGELSGEISEFFFSKENGQLENLLIHSDNKELFFPIESVISLGEEYVIINDSLIEINDQISQLEEGERQVTSLQVKAKTQSLATDKKAALKAKLVELLKGNSIKKDIFDKSGELLFEKGTILNDEAIKVLQDERAKVLIEISMDLKE
jgi:uncharacterized protein YrrD